MSFEGFLLPHFRKPTGEASSPGRPLSPADPITRGRSRFSFELIFILSQILWVRPRYYVIMSHDGPVRPKKESYTFLLPRELLLLATGTHSEEADLDLYYS